MYKMDMIKTFIIANGGIAKTSELNDLGSDMLPPLITLKWGLPAR